MKAASRELMPACEASSAPPLGRARPPWRKFRIGKFWRREREEEDELLAGLRRSKPLFKHKYLW